MAGLFVSVPGLRSHSVGLVQLHQEAFSQLPGPCQRAAAWHSPKAQSLHGCRGPCFALRIQQAPRTQAYGAGDQGLLQASVRSSPALLPLSSLPEGPFCHPTPMLLAPAHGLGLRSHQQAQESLCGGLGLRYLCPIVSVTWQALTSSSVPGFLISKMGVVTVVLS